MEGILAALILLAAGAKKSIRQEIFVLLLFRAERLGVIRGDPISI